jgi:hypothetical protein
MRRVSALLCVVGLTGGVVPLAQAPGFDVVGVIAGPADLIRVSGTIAYVAAGSTLSVVDVGDPSVPKPRGTLKLPAAATAMAVSGSTVYLALGLDGVVVVDAGSPEKPVLVGSHKTRGETLRIAASGSRLVVSDRMAGAVILDVSDRTKPVSRGSYYTDGYTRDVALADSTAYIVDSSNDFLVVDIARSNGPEATATAQSSLTSSIVAVSSGTSGARTAYVVGAGSLRAYDVSSPTAARSLGVAKVSGRASAIALDGPTGYLAAGADGLQMIDLSDPAKPNVSAVFKTSGAARDVAVTGGLVFVAVAPPSAPGGGAAATPGVQILRRTPR